MKFWRLNEINFSFEILKELKKWVYFFFHSIVFLDGDYLKLNWLETKIRTNSHSRPSETILNSFIVWWNFYARFFCRHPKTISHTLCISRIIKNKRLNLHAYTLCLCRSPSVANTLPMKFERKRRSRRRRGRPLYHASVFHDFICVMHDENPQIMQSVELVRN